MILKVMKILKMSRWECVKYRKLNLWHREGLRVMRSPFGIVNANDFPAWPGGLPACTG